MALSPKGIQRNKNVARGRQMSLVHYYELMDRMDTMMKMYEDTMEKTNHALGMLNMFSSRVDAIRMQLDNVHNSAMNLVSASYNLNNVHYQMQPVISTLNGLNGNINMEMGRLHGEVLRMKSIIEDVNKVASDPVIQRTIDDIRNLDGRIDTL